MDTAANDTPVAAIFTPTPTDAPQRLEAPYARMNAAGKVPREHVGPSRANEQSAVVPAVEWMSAVGAGPTPKGPKLIRNTRS